MKKEDVGGQKKVGATDVGCKGGAHDRSEFERPSIELAVCS